MAKHSKIITRPWGHYREYARNQSCTVWRVEMKPGESGSLQSHAHFDEVWTLLDDGAEVQVGERVWRPKAFEEFSLVTGDQTVIGYPRGELPTHKDTLMLYHRGEKHGAWCSDRFSPCLAARNKTASIRQEAGCAAVAHGSSLLGRRIRLCFLRRLAIGMGEVRFQIGEVILRLC